MNKNVSKRKKKLNHEKLRGRVKLKDCRKAEAANKKNSKDKQVLKRYILKFKVADNKEQRFSKLNSVVARACKKGLIHPNKRDRILSRLYKQITINAN